MREARQTNKNPFYKVEQVPLQTVDGYATSYLGNQRVDNKEILGICTDQYELVDNEELVDRAEAAMQRTGLPEGERKFQILEGGSKFYAQYDFFHVNKKVAKVNEELGLRLTIQNSFDRSLRVAVTLGMIRLVCTNGMTTMNGEFSLTQKHSANLDLSFMQEAIDAALNRYEESTKVFNRLASTAIDHEKGIRILDKLLNRSVFSNKVRDGIAKIWEQPTYREDQDRTLWNLYNATTQHLTHEVSKERYAYSNRVNASVLRHLNKEVSFAA